jgi:hypothetical protein
MVNDVYVSRQMGKVKPFLNKAGETELLRQVEVAKSYADLSTECKLWFKNPLSIPKKYLNQPAQKFVFKSKNK